MWSNSIWMYAKIEAMISLFWKWPFHSSPLSDNLWWRESFHKVFLSELLNGHNSEAPNLTFRPHADPLRIRPSSGLELKAIEPVLGGVIIELNSQSKRRWRMQFKKIFLLVKKRTFLTWEDQKRRIEGIEAGEAWISQKESSAVALWVSNKTVYVMVKT